MHLSTAALLSLASTSAAWSHLSAADFRATVQSDHTLVAFVEPRASTSKLEVEWSALDRQGFRVASVDCAQDAGLCDELDIASYPAIRLFHKGGHVRYRGLRRSHESIAAFLRRSQRPALSTVDSANATAFAAGDDVVFIARYSGNTLALPDRFASLARAYSDRYSFAVGPPSTTAPSVTCYNTRDGMQHAATDLAMASALDSLVRLCTTPVVAELTRRSELAVFGSGRSLVHYFYHDDDERRAYTDMVRPLAKTYREYLAFTTVDADEYGDDMMLSLGLTDGPGCSLVVQNPANGDVFPYTGKEVLSTAAVEQFIIDITKGAVKPWPPAPSHDEL